MNAKENTDLHYSLVAEAEVVTKISEKLVITKIRNQTMASF